MSDDITQNNPQGTPLERDNDPSGKPMTGMVPEGHAGAGNHRGALVDRMLALQEAALRLHPDADRLARQSAQREIGEATGTAHTGDQAPAAPSVSILKRRLRRFKSLKRGYYSFILLVALYLISFALPVLINNKPLMIHYNGSTYFPAFKSLLPGVSSFYPATLFGLQLAGEAPYRALKEQWKNSNSGNWIVMPPYTWDPYESDFESTEEHPQPPSARHLFGTDDTGRDVFSRLCYGFNVSISFAVALTLASYLIGGILGGVMGYYGGKVDLIGQRIQEIWENVPFLYTVIIISSIVIPTFLLLVVILALFGWLTIAVYVRGEFLREKSRDYVAAAISLGASDSQIIFRHILPNSLTPMISFLPFSIVGGISSLVALDFLGFGVPPPTPSWGQMVSVGLSNLDRWWLVTVPIAAMFVTLLLVSFIGESIREAFDPKVFSRLR